EVCRVPGGRGEEADGEVGSGAVEPDRVESPLGDGCRDALELLRARAPRLGGIGLVEPADVRDRLPEAVVRLPAVELRVDELRPAGRRRGRDAPVRGGAVDDVAGVRQVREDVAAGASRI